MNNADEPSSPAPQKLKKPTASQPRVVPPVRNILIALSLIVIGVSVWWFSLVGDHAVENIVLLILCFIGVTWPLFWFLFFSGQRGIVRFLPLMGMAIVMISPFLFVKLTDVNGELRPRFAWRWTPPADALLEVPPVVEASENVPATADLTSTTPQDFPQFLGPQRNLVLPEVSLAKDWQAHPPKKVWSKSIGAGWSAFAVVNGFAVTMEQRGDNELVTCYDVKAGELKWSHGIKARYATVIAGVGPRSTPTIHEGRVYALGGTGVLRCLDGGTGQLLWQKDLLKEFKIPLSVEENAILYGRSNSPLIVDDLVIVPAGGPSKEEAVALVAYDKATGEERWRGGRAQVGYASPSLAEIDGVRQIVIVNEASATAHDVATGQQLWSYPWPGTSNGDANCSQAVVMPDGHVLLSKAYGVGASLLKVSKGKPAAAESKANGPTKENQVAADPNSEWNVELKWHESGVMKTKFTNVAVVDGYAYGLSDGILECIDVQNGQRQWKKGRYHHGQVLAVGDVLLVMAEQTGEVVMVALTPERHQELGQFHALDSDKVWNNLALSGPYLLVRDAENAACYELKLE